MGTKEIDIAGNKFVIHEFDNVCDSLTGRPLTGSCLWDSALVLAEYISTHLDFKGKSLLELGAEAALLWAPQKSSLRISNVYINWALRLCFDDRRVLDTQEIVDLRKTLKVLCGKETAVWATSEVLERVDESGFWVLHNSPFHRLKIVAVERTRATIIYLFIVSTQQSML
ncbi:hypothetical protein ACOSQ3_000088 [Xanthoceras sorbifolium]